MKKIISLIAMFTLTLSSFALGLTVSAETNPAPNPALDDACGLDIAILLDMTGSIGDDVDTVKSAAESFVDAFLPATPTMIGLVEFSNGTASTVQDLTGDAADLKSDISGLSAAGATNWEVALLLGTAMLEGGSDRDDSEHPDLMVVITDGNPNEPGSNANALEVAIIAANAAKTSSASMPIRVIGIGVGDVDVNNLVAITGPNVNDDPITKDTDVITGDFGDLAGILGTLAAALCDPEECEGADGDDTVINRNSAVVVNRISANANTGGNSVGGSYAGAGGNGGAIINSGDDVDESSTGAGGRGGDSGTGGTIYTGNANANAGAVNVVNTNRTSIDRCNDCCSGEGDVRVANRNRAIVLNGVSANANTGYNEADGSYAGDGGNGGNINNNGDEKREEGGDVDESSTGAGGRGGNSGVGGFILSGHANSNAVAVNVVNRNVTRVRR